MSPADTYELVEKTLWLLFIVSAPALLSALVVGFGISLFQALTQIQEMTLTFVPKMVVVGLVILLTLPMIGSAFSGFMAEISSRIISGG